MTNPAFRTAIRRGTLAAAFIVIAVALGGAGFWYYQAQAKAIHQNSYETIAAISKMKVGQIVQWQKERLIDVTREANSPTLIKGLGMIARNAETPEIRDQALEILKLSKKQEEYSNIIALSPSGQVLFSTGDGPVSMGEATQRAVEAARANPSGAISDFFRTSEGEVDIDAVAAARDAGGSVLGFIVIRCRAAIYLYPLIQSWPMPSRTAETLLVEREGENVVFLNELRHRSKTALSFRHSLSQTHLPAVQAVLGRHGMFDGKDYRNVEVVADLSSIPGTPWFMVAKVDREEIMAEAGYRAASTGIIVGAFILLISLASALAYSWRHAKLLRKLLKLEIYQRQQQILSSQLAAIVESSDDAIIGKNLDGIITSWNRGAKKLFGYEASEMVGTSIMRLIPEDRQDEETLIMEKIRRGDSWEHFVTVRQAKDGRLIDVSITASPIKDAAGRIIGESKIARDITARKRSETVLQQSQERFRRYFELPLIGIAITSPTKGWLEVNDRLCETLGYSRTELLQMTWSELTDPEDISADLTQFERLLAGEIEGYQIEKRFIRKDGQAISTDLVVGCVRTETGAFDYAVALVQDITERKRMETVLRKNEERMRHIFEHQTVGMAVTAPDKKWLDVNDKLCQMLGYTREEMLQMTWAELTHPDDREPNSTLFKQILSGDIDNCNFEKRYMRKDGGVVDTMVSLSCVLRSDGNLDYVLLLVMDITERKQAERQVKESEARYAQLAEQSGTVAWEVDAQGLYVYVSNVSEAIWGYCPDELVGRMHFYDLHPESGREIFKTSALKVFEQKGSFKNFVNAIQTKDGQHVWVSTNGTPLLNADGTLRGYRGSDTDITEAKKIENTLRESAIRFTTLADSGQALIWTSGIDKKCNYFNRVWLAFTGRTLEQELGDGWAEGVHPDDLDSCFRTYVEAFDRNVPFSMDYRLRRHDGEYRWLQDEGSPRYSSEGEFLGYIGHCLDITDRKQAEAASAKYQLIAKHARDPLLLMEVDGKIVEANTAAEVLYGYSHEELLQLSISDLRLHADPEVISQQKEQAVTHGILFEAVHYRKDGSPVPVEVSSRGIVVDGKTMLSSVIRDITQRKQADAKMLLQSGALDAAANAIVITDSKGVIEWVNTAFTTFTGYTTKEAVGRTTNLLKSGKQDQAFYKKLWKTILAGEVWHGELINRRKDGTLYPEEMTITPIKNEDGKIAHFIAVKQDVTKRKQNEQSLLDAHEQLEQRVKDRTSDLNRSKNQLQLVLNSTAEAIYGIDMEGECTFCNSACLQMLGYEHEDELLGKNMHWQIHQKYPDGTHFPVEDCRIFRAFQKHEGSHVDDEVLWRADGTSFPAEYWSYPQQIDGVVVGAVVTFIDITERQLAQKRFELMFRNNPVMMVLSSMPDRRFSDVNDSFLKSLGYSRDDVIGKTAGEIGIIPNEKHLTEVADKLQEFGKITDTELQFRRKDGTMGDGIFSGEVIRSQGNWQLLTVMTDISGRKQAEDSLAKSAERLFLATSAGGVGVWDYDLIDNILTWDEQMFALYGITRESFGGAYEAWKAGLHPDDVERGDNEIQMALSGERDFDTEFRVVWPSGTVREIRALALVKRDASGQPVRMIGTNWDITERKRIDEALINAMEAAKSASKAKSAFLANMSHEIRTPMNAILGFSQILLQDSGLPARQKKHLETINRSGEHLLALINDILDMSKIEAGRVELAPSTFDLSGLLQNLQVMFLVRMDAKGLQLNVRKLNELPQFCVADMNKLMQVLINLLGNALKFTKQGGVTLRVYCEKKASMLFFEVEDTGIGIPEEAIDKLFVRFKQVYNDSQAGTGLGLAISREIAHLMGGEITVTSKVGKGSVFRFSIPLVEGGMKDVEPITRLQQVIGLKAGQPSYRVLIVDDMEDNIDLLTEMLSRKGFSTRPASSGKEALGLFKTWHPHLILMDMRMPSMDGVETIQWIRATAQGNEVKIMSVTANAFESTRQEALEAGADDFLGKPFRQEELFEKIRLLLGVEYEYDQEKHENALPDTLKLTDFSPEELASLPLDFAEQMRQAAVNADYDCLLELIQKVDSINHKFSQGLRCLAEQYDYQKLLDVLNPKRSDL